MFLTMVGFTGVSSRPGLAKQARQGDEPLAQLVVRRHHRAVPHLERRHFVHQCQVSMQRQLVTIEVQQMIERKEHSCLTQPCGHVEDVATQMLHVAMQRFRHLVRSDVYLDITIWKPARDLLADNHIIRIRTPLEQLEATIDGVVIGDADEIHPALASHAVDIDRPRVAIA
jgi:hypothetical protein